MADWLIACGVAFVVSLAGSRLARQYFARFVSKEAKPGKEKIQRLFPKPRRPLGGGLAILAAISVGFAISARRGLVDGWIAVGTAAAFGLLGFLDDLAKARGAGLSPRAKFTIQVLIAGCAGALLTARAHSHFVFPPIGQGVDFGLFYALWVALVIVATANAVNLSDGIDGLAASSAGIAFVFYWFVNAAVASTPIPGSGVLSAAAVGACAGFLTHNFPPASLLMGDCGALALGALLAMVALQSRTEWWLLLFGSVFVIDAASVLIQTGTIRLFRFPVRLLRHRVTEVYRPYLCTPLHHHFQWLGWTERRILGFFVGVGLLTGFVGLCASDRHALWVAGLAIEAAVLAGAAIQKAFAGNYFLGIEEQENRLALYSGLPLAILGRKLYRLNKRTQIARSSLPALASDSLWRTMTETEAQIMLGRIYALNGMWDEAVQEWEQVPPRSLALRDDVVEQLGKVYYGRDMLLKAVRLWEQVPSRAPAVAVKRADLARSAKIRLAELAGKVHRQSLRLWREARDAAEQRQAIAQLERARALNRDLLSLLASERERRPPTGGQQPADKEPRDLFRQMERHLTQRLEEIEAALHSAVTPARPATIEWDEHTAAACRQMGIAPEDMVDAFSQADFVPAAITSVQECDIASRNAIFRLRVRGGAGEELSAVGKAYQEGRVEFFAACYRRERGLLEWLRRLGCAVPRVYGGVLKDNLGLLVLEDAGERTLSDLLAAADERARPGMLREAAQVLADLHARTREASEELRAQVMKADKEVLDEVYYVRTCITAVERISEHMGLALEESQRGDLEQALAPVAQMLASQPRAFVHFEYAPHHLLVSDRGLTIFDFEQATIGPPEFDLATLVSCPEGKLPSAGREELVNLYWSRLDDMGASSLPPGAPEVLDYATIVKSLFYAGAAANFYRKFGTAEYLDRMKWYLGECDAALSRHEALADLRDALRPLLVSAGLVAD